MQFGYVLENYGDGLDREPLRESAILAEKVGFSSIWATDHVLPPRVNDFPRFNTITEAITTISYLAGCTEYIKIGVSTLVLPLRNPILVAKQIASLDFLTEGRVIMSFGAGLSKGEFGFMNAPFSNRGKRFNEGLQLVKALWRGEGTFAGNYYSFEDASFNPAGHSGHKIPIWIAGNTERALKRAIKYGDGWHPVNMRPEAITQRLKSCTISLPKKGFDIAVRISPNNDHSLQEIVENYEKANVTHLILKISGGLEALDRVADEISSFTNTPEISL